VAGFYEHGTDNSDPINAENFLTNWTDYRFFQESLWS